MRAPLVACNEFGVYSRNLKKKASKNIMNNFLKVLYSHIIPEQRQLTL